MDESALRTLIDNLEKLSGPLHTWMHFWTALVILGCAGELYFVINAHMDERKLWFNAKTKGFVAPPEKPSAIVLFFELLSVAAVVIGIAGELSVDFKAGRLESQLRDANSKLILLLGKEVGSAKASSEAAAGSAQRALEAEQILEGKVADTATDVKGIKKAQADRTPIFTATDIEILRKFGSVKSRTLANAGANEAILVADRITKLLSDAGTDPLPFGQILGSDVLLNSHGVHIRAPDKYREVADALRKILVARGVPSDVAPSTRPDVLLASEKANDTLVILVGPK